MLEHTRKYHSIFYEKEKCSEQTRNKVSSKFWMATWCFAFKSTLDVNFSMPTAKQEAKFICLIKLFLSQNYVLNFWLQDKNQQIILNWDRWYVSMQSISNTVLVEAIGHNWEKQKQNQKHFIEMHEMWEWDDAIKL